MKEEDIIKRLDSLEVRIGFILILLGIITVILIIAALSSCTKLPEPQEQVNNCYDCTIKQDKIEVYKAIYCCTEAELQVIISSEANKGTTIKCKKQ